MRRDLIDLSHPIEAGMTTYPGLPGPILTDFLSREDSRERYRGKAEFHIGRIEMVANTGTYLDAPFHRYAAGKDIGELSLERIAHLRGVVVDLPDHRRAIGSDTVKGLSVEGCAVIVHTGWSSRWRTSGYGDSDHPYLSREAAEGLVRAGAALVGIDSVNIDSMDDPSRPAHTLLLEAGIPIVEHLTNLAALVGRSFTFSAVPAPVRGMGTFPVRAFAIVE
jgi:kynurenine formamidase